MYRATVRNNANGTEAEYIGITDLAFKAHYNNHSYSFRNEAKKKKKKKQSTALSAYVWASNLNPNRYIKREIMKKMSDVPTTAETVRPLPFRNSLHSTKSEKPQEPQ